MTPDNTRVLFVLACLSTGSGCQENPSPLMSPSDQAAASSGDMATMTDAGTSTALGMVRYSYICDNKPEKAVELPHIRFGATYSCLFKSDSFQIEVKDDRVPVDFRLFIPGYHGPGTYTMIADKFSGMGFTECVWPSIRIQDGNCPALANSTISPCCLDQGSLSQGLSCTIVVQQHSSTRVTGTFECTVAAYNDGPNSPDTCPFRGMAQVKGSFDFGPQDCVTK